MNNLDVREAIRKSRVCHYEVAMQLHISEYTFCRWLRQELSDEKKNKIYEAIKEIVGGENE